MDRSNSFSCDDVRILRNDDLRLLYAMVHKIRVSPVKAMVAHWQGGAERISPIEFTSIIIGLANFFACLIALYNIYPHHEA
jgi:hypothetical protein